VEEDVQRGFIPDLNSQFREPIHDFLREPNEKFSAFNDFSDLRNGTTLAFVVCEEISMSRSFIALSAFLGLVAAPPAPASASDLKPETITVWNEYVRSADSRMKDRLEGKTSFLWTDESADRRRRVSRGETPVSPAVSHGTQTVPNGLIHHWIGSVFISGAAIDSLSAVLQNYSAYKDVYKPVVVDSKRLSCTSTEARFRMLWQTKVLFITAAIEGEYQAHHVRVDSRRGYDISESIQVHEVENYGHAGQRLLPDGTGSGYIWRLHSIARYEQRDGGVDLELEAIALTRDIPASVRWLVNPIVNHLSVNSLITTLQQTRDAVNALPSNTDTSSICSEPNRPLP
jgi:hypothetical protein